MNITGYTSEGFANTNAHIFQPFNTGSPHHDLHRHYSGLGLFRRHFEEMRLTGTRLSRVAPDDVPSSDAPSIDAGNKVRITAPEYAVKRLGNDADAREFIRCVRLIAGADADAPSLQRIAGYYYKQIAERAAPEVLKEMALLAMQLEAATATLEERHLDAPEDEALIEVEPFLTNDERRELSRERARQVLDETAVTNLFADELRHMHRRAPQLSKHHRDEFREYFADGDANAQTAEEADEWLVRELQFEQYTEDGVVSLHMTDGERLVPCGDLTDDITPDCLPEYARHLADELERLYVNGFPAADAGARASRKAGAEPIACRQWRRDPETREWTQAEAVSFGLDTWIALVVDELFIDEPPRAVTRRALRSVPRTAKYHADRLPLVASTLARAQNRVVIKGDVAFVSTSTLHEQTYTVEVLPHAEARAHIRSVLETLLEHLKRDAHARSQHASDYYRSVSRELEATTDAAHVARLKREAWLAKEDGRISLSVFTLFNTRAAVRESLLATTPLREERTDECERTRTFIVAQPLLNEASDVRSATISDFARRLSALPRQERERVRRHVAERNPRFYARVLDGLRQEIARASAGKLRYFRWALYPGNKPEHPVHVLTAADQAATWRLLKERTAKPSGVRSAPLVH